MIIFMFFCIIFNIILTILYIQYDIRDKQVKDEAFKAFKEEILKLKSYNNDN